MKKNLVWMTAFISGVSIFVNKFGVSFSNPFVFTFIKNAIVALLLFSIIMLFRNFKDLRGLQLRDWAILAAIGLIGGSIPFLLFFKGLSITTSAKAAFIHKTMFIYIGLLAFLFLKERFTKTAVLGAGLLLAGNFLFLKMNWQPLNIGDLMVFGATLLWAAENTISKNVLNRLDSNTVAFGRMFFGSVFILGFLAATGNLTDIVSLTAAQLAWSIVPAVLLFGYVMTWYTGLKTITVTKASVILLLGSPITTLLNIIWTGNMIALQQAAGAAMLLLGVILFSTSVSKIPNKKVFFV